MHIIRSHVQYILYRPSGSVLLLELLYNTNNNTTALDLAFADRHAWFADCFNGGECPIVRLSKSGEDVLSGGGYSICPSPGFL